MRAIRASIRASTLGACLERDAGAGTKESKKTAASASEKDRVEFIFLIDPIELIPHD
jgi:hypothetical protein